MKKIERICTLGVGTVGAGWAAFYASRGLSVTLTDSSAQRVEIGLRRARENLEFLRTHGLTSAEAFRKGMEHMVRVVDLGESVSEADLIHESVFEDLNLKRDLYRQVEARTPQDTVILSSTSFLRPSELQRDMSHPERLLIAHPFNPPHLIPLVELVGGKKTAPELVGEVRSWYEALGKVPVVLQKEIFGHIANRLAAAVWREAIDLVSSGVASVEDVDKTLSAGPGLRYALMGQHMIYHLAGGEGGMEYCLQHLGDSFNTCWKDLAAWTSFPEGAGEQLVEGIAEAEKGRSISEIAAWRDTMLARLVKEIYG